MFGQAKERRRRCGGSADAVEFQALRLRVLREHPEAYGSSEEEEAALPLEAIAQRLDDSSGESVQPGHWPGAYRRRAAACS